MQARILRQSCLYRKHCQTSEVSAVTPGYVLVGKGFCPIIELLAGGARPDELAGVCKCSKQGGHPATRRTFDAIDAFAWYSMMYILFHMDFMYIGIQVISYHVLGIFKKILFYPVHIPYHCRVNYSLTV
ncbi:MAG: hypothetical protein U0T82_14485 [Bacteroidales bacterium]